jgi:FixJ family two-component response regulator
MISIIDDDRMVRDSTADLISSLGHEALIFGSAEQFLASGCVKDTACIITDVHMPGLNGLDLLSRLLAEGYRTPVIFITAYPGESARSRALNAGAVAFLSKPFEESALISSLETALKRREKS